MLPRRCAWPSSSASRSASPGVRQVNSTPAKNGITVRSAITGWPRSPPFPAASASAGQRGADGAGHVLGVPAGEHPLGPRVEAVARRRGRVGLEQGERGELGRRAAERVGVAGAQVHDGEVGDLAAGAAQRPGQQHRVRDLVERGEDGGRRRPRPDVAVGEAHAEHVGEAGHHRRQQAPGVGVELPPRLSPPGLGHAEQDARPVAEARAPRGPRSVPRAPRRPPGRTAAAPPPTTGPRRWRRPAAPGSRTAAAAAASGSSRCRRGRPGRAARARRRRQAARPRPPPPRTSVPAGRPARRPVRRRPWRASSPPARATRRPRPAAARARATPPRRAAPPAPAGRPIGRAEAGGAESAGADGGSCRSTAAAISVTGMPAAAAMSASWRIAATGDSPCRSISTPRAIAATSAACASARARTSSRRWRSMTAARLGRLGRGRRYHGEAGCFRTAERLRAIPRHPCLPPSPPTPRRRDAETVPSATG